MEPVDTKKIQDEAVQRFNTLPQDVKDAMMSVSTSEIIYETGRKFGLNIEKTGLLAKQVGFVMLGMLPARDFIRDMIKILGVDPRTAQGLAADINHRIFLPIRENLKKIHGVAFNEDVSRQPQDMPQKPLDAPQASVTPHTPHTQEAPTLRPASASHSHASPEAILPKPETQPAPTTQQFQAPPPQKIGEAKSGLAQPPIAPKPPALSSLQKDIERVLAPLEDARPTIRVPAPERPEEAPPIHAVPAQQRTSASPQPDKVAFPQSSTTQTTPKPLFSSSPAIFPSATEKQKEPVITKPEERAIAAPSLPPPTGEAPKIKQPIASALSQVLQPKAEGALHNRIKDRSGYKADPYREPVE